MGRRARSFVVFAVLIAAGVLVGGVARAEENECPAYFKDGELGTWTDLLQANHLTGTSGHKALIDYLEDRLKPLVPPKDLVREETKFTRWEAYQPTIDDCVSKPCVDSIWSLPYSGFTTAEGVSAPPVYGGSGALIGLRTFHFSREKHGGKIVVLRTKPLRMREILALISTRTIPESGLCGLGAYRRAISLEVQVPSLEEARNAGVVGLIVVIDQDPKIAQDQYVPFTRDWQDIPAVFVDKKFGDTLIKKAKESQSVTLRQTGTRVPDTVSWHLLATLRATPKDKIDDQVIVIDTHTDGPNFFEEDGVMALGALFEKLADSGPRQRDLVFVFAAGHFSHQAGSTDDVIRRNPDVFDKTRAALVIEHLGARQWSADSKKPEKPEPALVLTNTHAKDLRKLAKKVMAEQAAIHESLPAAFFIRPQLFMFGEGKFLAERDIPTIGYLTNPEYLFATGDWHEKWFSAPMMCDQLGMFEQLIREMMKLDMPAKK